MLMHDQLTFAHMQRVGRIAKAIARAMGLPLAAIRAISEATYWHDIGKLAIPRYTLNKPAALDAVETMTMRIHPQAGRAMLERLDPPASPAMLDAALHHHERFDGAGYPHSLSGHDIPLAARIAAVADFYDALSMCRPYREALPIEHVVVALERESGVRFDPAIVEALVTLVRDGWS